MDTDILLAMLASLAEPHIQNERLMEALVECEGDVEKAAELLSVRSPSSEPVPAKKRKRTADLSSWIGSTTKKLRDNHPPEEPPLTNVGKHSSLLDEDCHEPYTTSKIAIAFQPSSLDTQPEDDVPPQKPVSSSSKVKIVTNEELMKLLRPPNSTDSAKELPRFPPLTLATPTLVAQHTPCTLHTSVLPTELACRLFFTMLHESRGWKRNKWWLFDRVVESPHRTSFYIRHTSSGENGDNWQEAAQFWYNGRPTEPPSSFPPAMEDACKIIERVVNESMRKRKRFPLEWAGSSLQDDTGHTIIWRANVAASNCYEGAKESVGFHSDQLTNLGPYPTIASLSLGTDRIFRLREVIPENDKSKRNARTYNIPLPHNSLVIMHASAQENFKHSIPPQNTIDLFRPPFPPPPEINPSGEPITTSNARINITFRFYRPDYKPDSIPRCKCGVPCILRPDMKHRQTFSGYQSRGNPDDLRDMVTKYWWTCYAGAQNEGKGCGFWRIMDIKSEGRGPFVGPIPDASYS